VTGSVPEVGIQSDPFRRVSKNSMGYRQIPKTEANRGTEDQERMGVARIIGRTICGATPVTETEDA
jgi:hypothetical protein